MIRGQVYDMHYLFSTNPHRLVREGPSEGPVFKWDQSQLPNYSGIFHTSSTAIAQPTEEPGSRYKIKRHRLTVA